MATLTLEQIRVWAKLTNIDPTELETALTKSGGTGFIEETAAIEKALQLRNEKNAEDGQGNVARGRKEALLDLGKKLKAKLKLDKVPKTADEILASLEATPEDADDDGEGNPPNPKSKELTKAELLKNPIVKQLLEEKARLATEWEQKYEQISSEFEHDKVFNQTQGKIEEYLAKKNPMWSDGAFGIRQKKLFLGTMQGYKWKIGTDGKPYPVDADGEALRDPSNNNKLYTLESLIDSNIPVDYSKAGAGTGGNNGNPNPASGGGNGGNAAPTSTWLPDIFKNNAEAWKKREELEKLGDKVAVERFDNERNEYLKTQK